MTDIGSYNYATDPALAALRERDLLEIEKMRRYGVGDFGVQLVEHQARVAEDAANFWRYLHPDSPTADIEAANIGAALRLHDWGKIHSSYDPAIWQLEDRPTPEQKKLQKKHAEYGARMLDELTEELGEIRDHPHILLRRDLTLYHHERVDGKGPQGADLSKKRLEVQVSTLADSNDGDMIPRPHQKGPQRTHLDELRRLSGLPDGNGQIETKYVGAFPSNLTPKYIHYRAEMLKIPLTELASHANVPPWNPSPP